MQQVLLLEVSIVEYPGLDWETQDQVAEITESQVEEEDGGGGGEVGESPAVIVPGVGQCKEGEEVAKCPNENNDDNVEDEDGLVIHDNLRHTVVSLYFSITGAVLCQYWAQDREKDDRKHSGQEHADD